VVIGNAWRNCDVAGIDSIENEASFNGSQGRGQVHPDARTVSKVSTMARIVVVELQGSALYSEG
jgi:hypothetical protein